MGFIDIIGVINTFKPDFFHTLRVEIQKRLLC